MKNLFTFGLIASVFVCLSLTLPGYALAADEGSSYSQAAHLFDDALAKGDQSTVSSLLDDNFQWVESDGKIHTKSDVLRDLGSLARDNEGAIDVRTLDLLRARSNVLLACTTTSVSPISG